jgi:hypothetical protein
VLSAQEAAALEAALASAEGSWLVQGYLLARAGVLDEAEASFARLAAANPSSAEAAPGRRPKTAPQSAAGEDDR